MSEVDPNVAGEVLPEGTEPVAEAPVVDPAPEPAAPVKRPPSAVLADIETATAATTATAANVATANDAHKAAVGALAALEAEFDEAVADIKATISEGKSWIEKIVGAVL